MSTLNIFKSIDKTTHRIEPFHSQFLGDALCASLGGDRSLFEGIWKLCAPADWRPPQNAKVHTEYSLDGAQRIDILITEPETGRVLGIEVKTSRASARSGQLEGYLRGLQKKYDDEKIAIAYLTPFNRKRAETVIGAAAGTLSTVEVFEAFRRDFDRTCHVSWLDVAEIEWNGGEIWSQHRAYVRNRMASPDRLRETMSRNRSLNEFFSDEAVEAFWDALPQRGLDDANGGVLVNLEVFEGSPNQLAKALTILIEDGGNVSRRSKTDRFREELRLPFLELPHGAFHEAIFNLSRRFDHVWVQGERNYGLRVGHKDHSSGVSLVTSHRQDCLVIGRRR